MENKLKYLEMIQSVINRMAANSFALKGWAVTLVAGIFVLAGKDVDKMYFLVAYIPIIVFWGLDSYYLMMEKRYRALYEKARMLTDNQIDFDMKPNAQDIKDKKLSMFACMLSKTEFWFYLPLALVTAGIIIITHI